MSGIWKATIEPPQSKQKEGANSGEAPINTPSSQKFLWKSSVLRWLFPQQTQRIQGLGVCEPVADAHALQRDLEAAGLLIPRVA